MLLRNVLLANIYAGAALQKQYRVRKQAQQASRQQEGERFCYARASVISLSLSAAAAAANDLYLFRSSKTLLAVNINGSRRENCL
jgi:hypothetical protein